MELDRLATLVRYNRATEAEKKDYLAMKIAFLSDRLDLLEYYHQRLEAMTTQQSLQLIAHEDIQEGHEVAQQIKVEIAQLQTELQAI